jgi:hypothetical protein
VRSGRWLSTCLKEKREILGPVWVRLPQPRATIGFTNNPKGPTLHNHDINLRELVLTKTPTMAPPRAARSTSRRNTPLSPPKNAGAVALSGQSTGRRSTRSQSRDISVASNEHSNLASRKVKERRGVRVPETGKDFCTIAFARGDYQLLVPKSPFLTSKPALDTVPENAEVDYPELSPSDAADAAVDLDDDEFEASSSAYSGITSDTQYELSRLDRELMVNALPFLHQYSNSLLNLFSSEDASDLLQLHRDLQQPTSKASKRFNALLEGFMLNRKHYGDDTPIDLDVAVRALAGLRHGDEIPNGAWRPDAVLYLANLARYISTIYASNENSEEARATLNSMFNSFPAPFASVPDTAMNAPGYSSSDLPSPDTLALVLETRTQYLFHELSKKHSHPAFDPDETLRAIFYVDHDRLRGVDYMDELSTLPSDFEVKFTQRITAIRRHFSNDISNPVDFGGLRREFPYTRFLIRLAKWTQLMTKQYRGLIAEYGGISQIQSRLQDEDTRRQFSQEDRPPARSQPSISQRQGEVSRNLEQEELASSGNDLRLPDLRGPKTPSKMKSPQSTKGKPEPKKSLEWRAKQQQKSHEMLAAIKARKAAEAVKNTREILPPAVEAHTYDTYTGGDDEPILTSPPRTQGVPALSQQGLTVLATLKTHAEQSNKENIDNSRTGKMAFIDRQRGAERITFDSQDEAPAVPSKTPTERKAPELETDDEEDDFEVDTRTAQPVHARQKLNQAPHTGGGLRRSKAASKEHTSGGPPHKKARVERTHRNVITDEEYHVEEGEDDDDVAASSQLRREEANRNQRRSGSSLPPTQRLPLLERRNGPPSSSAPVRGSSEVLPVGTQVSLINQEARQNTAKRLLKKRQPQQRSRWTEVEVERLVELIENYGVSWAYLLAMDGEHPQGPVLQQRDQGSLRDKARNMKMDFLKYVFLSTVIDIRTLTTG